MLKNRGFSALPAIILVVLVILVGAYFVFSGDESESMADLSDDRAVVVQANDNVLNEGSYVLDADVTFNVNTNQSGSTQDIQGSIAMNGYLNYADLASPELDINILIPEISMTQGGSGKISFGPINLDTRQIGDVAYFRVNEANIGFIDISGIYGTWIKSDPYNTPGLSAEELEQLQAIKAQQMELAEEVKEAIKGLDLYGSIERVGEEDVNGVSTYHYALTLDNQKVQSFLAGFFDGFEEGLESLSDEEREAVSGVFDSMEESIKKFKFDQIEINEWIGQNDQLPRKTVVSFDLATLNDFIADFSEELGVPQQGSISGNITMTALVSDYGLKRDVVAPADAIDTNAAMSQLYGI